MTSLKYKIVSKTGSVLRRICADRLIVPNGQVFDIPKNLDDYNRCALLAGRYEYAEIKLINTVFKEDDVIIEIGANIGVVARYAFIKKLTSVPTLIEEIQLVR